MGVGLIIHGDKAEAILQGAALIWGQSFDLAEVHCRGQKRNVKNGAHLR